MFLFCSIQKLWYIKVDRNPKFCTCPETIFEVQPEHGNFTEKHIKHYRINILLIFFGIKYEFEPKFVFHNIFLPYLLLFDEKSDVKIGVKLIFGQLLLNFSRIYYAFL